jgi:putative transposase
MMHLSVKRTMVVCYLFLIRVRGLYGRKPILTYKVRRYDEACRWLRMPDSNYPMEENLIERSIQEVQDRTECFDDSFPCRKVGCDRSHVWNWLDRFLLHARMKQGRVSNPPSS